VLAPELAADAEALSPRRTVAVPNGISDPGPHPRRLRSAPFEILFLGLGSREKGLFDTIDALATLNSRRPGTYRLTFAGGFASHDEKIQFQSRAAEHGDAIRYAGFADEAQKQRLYAAADLFCLPTSYPQEGQPLAILEALANDLPIVTTRWRAIPGMLPQDNVFYVEPGKPSALAAAVEAAEAAPAPDGQMRRYFLNHFTLGRHLDSMAAALRSLEA
jgi:glycosyltransferase involved in cell wall biosynthesis